ncbi:CheB methylesterase domain-containing protein [Mahella sp.]|uniref:CheB methylesterase domain-containing protein n=1 Tax=Mahella sp. TaxID=2798721 RepID=UPI0025C72EC6|nr:CheB methylesterase domain-containing protein [Mahella sp.]MBZ4665480.1 CheB methylesterase [Mahella sp.]
MTDTIIAIGSSTGGPRALERILTALPADIKAPVVIAQHMPKGFTASLAQRLDMLCDIHVREAGDGDILENGTAYIAPGSMHMTVTPRANGRLALHIFEDEIKSYYKPSIDVLMKSIAPLPIRKIGIILTGMGSDGAIGLKAIKQNGGITLAQDEASCVVFGMPAAAIKEQAVDKVLPLNDIATEIIKILGV